MNRALLLALSLLLATPAASTEQTEDQLVWDFGEFTQAFVRMDWETVLRFVSPATKASFGGDTGPAGVLRVFADDPTCQRAMAEALAQGCRKVGTGTAMQCIAPPQAAESDVVYLGARASFQFNESAERWMAGFLICGGD